MPNPYASSSIAVSSRSSIRHRSGTFSPSLGRRRGESVSNSTSSANIRARAPTYTDLTVQVEDTDDSGSKPTILLVQRSPAARSSAEDTTADLTPPRSPALPFHNGTVSKNTLARARLAEFESLPVLDKHDVSPVVHAQDAPAYGAPFSPVPLTPRPSVPTPSPEAFGVPAATTNHSQKVLLPQYIPQPASSSLPQRLLSWRKSKSKPKPTPTYDDEWSKSVPSTHSKGTIPPSSSSSAIRPSGTSSTVRYKRPLAPATPTHDKLTKKFPISASVRKLSALGRGKVGDHALAIVLLDESAGMGVERVGRWTAHKWCLFLSVWTLCGYGATGLVCAVLTWFTGSSTLSWPLKCDFVLTSRSSSVKHGRTQT